MAFTRMYRVLQEAVEYSACLSPLLLSSWSSWLPAVVEHTQSDDVVDEFIMPDIARQENNDLTRKYFNLRLAKPEDICKDSKLEEKYTPC